MPRVRRVEKIPLTLPPLLSAVVGLRLAISVAAAGEQAEVSFVKDIAPILVAKCATCHQPSKTKGNYQVHTFGAFMTPGRSKEPPVVAGHPEKSHLFQLLIARDPDDRMPQKDDALLPEQIALFRRWIEQGAIAAGIDRDKPLSDLAAPAKQPAPPVRYPRTVPILALAFHPTTGELAAGGYHEVTVWNPTQRTLVRRIQNVARQVQQLAFSPDGRLLAVAAGTPGRLGEVKLFDPSTGKFVRAVGTASDLMNSVAFNSDGKRLAMAGADNSVTVIDVESGDRIFRSELNADWVMQLAYRPDDNQLASASRDKTVRLIDGKTGELEQTYAGHSGAVFAVAFSPDGKEILSAGRDRSIQLWQETDAKKLGEAGPLPAEILRFVPIKERLYVGLSDGEIREYQINGKRVELVQIVGRHGDFVGALAAHEATGRLASGGYDGRIRLWRLGKAELESDFLAMPEE